RVYTFKEDAQRKLVDEYLDKAFIPAMNRLGGNPVGAFAEAKPNSPLHVLIAYGSMDGYMKAAAALLSDTEHLKAGASMFEPGNKPYEKMDSSLMQAFEGSPKLVVPPQGKEKKAHILQSRT